MPFHAGTQVGPYRILEQLGQGGMATVYKAYHASLDRYVAIKVLHRAFMEDASFHARFQREARVVARLEHPNIVPVYDYAEHEEQPYLVMKFIEGETLKARMDRGPLSAGEVLRVAETIGAALTYAHRHGILHRDIKPSNVIWSNDGEIYLADFGLARIAQSGESTLTSDMVLGTPHYISPEQAMAKKDLDEGTDIYSFGVMLYEMTVGKVPYNADTPFSIIHDHIYAPLPLPSVVNPGVSADVERVLLKALAKERADRYPDVTSMIAAFKEAWTGAPYPTGTMSTALPPRAAAPVTEATAIATAGTVAPETMRAPLGSVTPPPTASGATQVQANVQSARGRSPWLWVGGGLLVGMLLCVGVGLVVFRGMRNNAANATAVAHTPTDAADAVEHGEATLEGESVDLADANLERAKEQAEQRPRDPRAHFRYGYALIEADQEQEGYDAVKRGANLAGRNQALLVGAAKAFESQELWLAAALIYTQMAQNLRAMPLVLLENMDRAVYYGFEEDDAPEILPYETLNSVDHALALIAEARHSLSELDDFDAIRRLIDELDVEKPGLEETKLLRAELAIDEENITEAETILQELIDTPDASAWIREEAEELLSDIR